MFDGLRGLLLVSMVMATAGLALFRPFAGLLGFIAFSIVSPQSMAWSTSATFNPVQPIAAATLIGYFVSSEPKRLPGGTITYLLLALWTVFVMTTVTAVYQDSALGQLVLVSKILLMVALSLAMVTSKERLLALLRTIALSIGVLGLKAGMFAIGTGGQEMVWGPINSYLEANNTIGVALAMNLPLLFYLRSIENRRWLRRLMLAMMLLSYPAIVCTFSRGAWLSATAATALMLWRTRYRRLVVAGLLLALPLLSTDFLPDRVANRFEELRNYEDDTSAQSRFWTWEFCKRVGVANPLTGAGFHFPSDATFRQYYPEFLAWRGRVSTCHSAWLTIFGEHGVPGFVLWVSLLGVTFATAAKTRQAAKRAGPDGAWAVSVAEMLQAALLAYVVGATFVDLNYFDVLYQLVAVAVMLKTLAPTAAPGKTSSRVEPPDPLNRRVAAIRPKR